MTNQQRKLLKEFNKLTQSIQILTTGDNKRFLELSHVYKSDRKRIHKEILHKYTDLFAVIQSIRKLSVLGVQNVDSLVEENEADFQHCIKRYNALKPLLIKYIDVFDEIICLIENGFPDGAMQRWRTFLEYSIIIIFILEQGEEVAEAYGENFLKSIEDGLRPRTNFAWAKAAKCLKEEKQISITKLLDNINGIDSKNKNFYRAFYKLISQSIHGSPVGINLSFNDHISFDINDLNTKDSNYYTGGISTVITNTMNLLFYTFTIYFNTIPDGGVNIKEFFKEQSKEYVKVYKRFF
ncbi:DUF5677 domain-containing protein [Neobacillus niacini]|uniref:DUF5677 domain-containing protein n=1 Tax=Neobacillus niacini TaxID=86668 RepID=UPI002FFEBC25